MSLFNSFHFQLLGLDETCAMCYSLNNLLTVLPVPSKRIYLAFKQLRLSKYRSKTVAPNSNLGTFGTIYLVILKVQLCHLGTMVHDSFLLNPQR